MKKKFISVIFMLFNMFILQNIKLCKINACDFNSLKLKNSESNLTNQILNNELIETNNLILTTTSPQDENELASILMDDSEEQIKLIDLNLQKKFSNKQEAIDFLKFKNFDAEQTYSKTIKLKNNFEIIGNILISVDENMYINQNIFDVSIFLNKNFQKENFAFEAMFELLNKIIDCSDCDMIRYCCLTENVYLASLVQQVFSKLIENRLNLKLSINSIGFDDIQEIFQFTLKKTNI